MILQMFIFSSKMVKCVKCSNNLYLSIFVWSWAALYLYIHLPVIVDRMPVILADKASTDTWLNISSTPKFDSVLKPYEKDDLVNNIHDCYSNIKNVLRVFFYSIEANYTRPPGVVPSDPCNGQAIFWWTGVHQGGKISWLFLVYSVVLTIWNDSSRLRMQT